MSGRKLFSTAGRASTVPTVAACQCALSDLDQESNRQRVRERVADLPARADLAVFPEYALTGFADDDRLERVSMEREEATAFLGDLATSHDVALVAGYAERGAGTLYNATAYVSAAGESTVYRKRHRWGAETARITPGEERVVVETPLGRAGLLTCYDLNFVEESAWFTRERVDALLVTGAWPAPHGENWRLLVRARAFDGVRWVVGANRTGERTVGEAGVYAGRSLVARPNGTVRSSLDVAPGTLVVDVDPAELARHRETVGVFEG